MKVRRKRINKKREKMERMKTGLSRGEMKMLSKNKSVLQKQLKDSSKKKINFTRTSQFFKHMQDSQTPKTN